MEVEGMVANSPGDCAFVGGCRCLQWPREDDNRLIEMSATVSSNAYIIEEDHTYIRSYLVSLALDTEVHDVISANSAVINDNVPCPERYS